MDDDDGDLLLNVTEQEGAPPRRAKQKYMSYAEKIRQKKRATLAKRQQRNANITPRHAAQRFGPEEFGYSLDDSAPTAAKAQPREGPARSSSAAPRADPTQAAPRRPGTPSAPPPAASRASAFVPTARAHVPAAAAAASLGTGRVRHGSVEGVGGRSLPSERREANGQMQPASTGGQRQQVARGGDGIVHPAARRGPGNAAGERYFSTPREPPPGAGAQLPNSRSHRQPEALPQPPAGRVAAGELAQLQVAEVVPLGACEAARMLTPDSFEGLGLAAALAEHMAAALNLTRPTHIQRAAIPVLLMGGDAVVQADTGTGKTVTFLAPVMHRLLTGERISRADGTLAVVLSPTRELCLQIAGVLAMLCKRFHWIVPGTVMGGESKQKEKARLRKGVTVLVATPGRLLDHLRNTRAFCTAGLCALVMDEADRLLDMGFERDILDILQLLRSRHAAATAAGSGDGEGSGAGGGGGGGGSWRQVAGQSQRQGARQPVNGQPRRSHAVSGGRGHDRAGADGEAGACGAVGGEQAWQTILLSATMSVAVDRLASVSLRNPAVITVKGSTGSGVGELSNERSGRNEAAGGGRGEGEREAEEADGDGRARRRGVDCREESGRDGDRQTVGDEDEEEDDGDELLAANARRRLRAAEAASDEGGQESFSLPSQLRQTYLLVPCKLRLVALVAALRGHARSHAAASGGKVVVFFSSCDACDFHHSFLSSFRGRVGIMGEVARGKRSLGKRPGAAANSAVATSAAADTLLSQPVYKLHGNMTQAERSASFVGFVKAPCGVLICTDVAARGLDIPNVTCIVQYDPPGDVSDYVHRVGRTARLGRSGEAVLFLQPHERDYVDALQRMGVGVEQVDADALLRGFLEGDGGKGGGGGYSRRRLAGTENGHSSIELLAMGALRQFEMFLAGDKQLRMAATDAFRSFVRAYAVHPAKLKSIFHVRKLHLGHVAKSFALKDAPTLLGQSSSKLALKRKKQEAVEALRSKRTRLKPATED